MNWWFVIAGLVIAIVALVIVDRRSRAYSEWPVICAVLVGIITLLVLFVCIFLAIAAGMNVAVFEEQKQYIETHIPKSEIEDAALTTKKIELNEWLYLAQYKQAEFGGFSFYGEEIQELEPID